MLIGWLSECGRRMHYAHNIMIDENGNSILGDFGGASYYEKEDKKIGTGLEQLEVRAFGCLIEELLYLSKEDNYHKNIKESLFQLQILCINENSKERPLFKEVIEKLNTLVGELTFD